MAPHMPGTSRERLKLNPNFIVEFTGKAIDAESFRKAWESAVMKIERKEFRSDFRSIDKNGDFIDPKPIISRGKNLYSRKLRIRR